MSNPNRRYTDRNGEATPLAVFTMDTAALRLIVQDTGVEPEVAVQRETGELKELILHVLKQDESQDFFLKSEPDQPKQTIHDYLKSFGIDVPETYPMLKEALLSGKKIIIRSEHKKEYAGLSGLLESYVFDPDAETKRYDFTGKVLREVISGNKSEADLHERLIADSERNLVDYARLSGEDLDEFKRGISYSYWEHIEGINRTVVADSNISGRYHIFGTGEKDSNLYSIVENGQIIFSQDGEPTPEKLVELIETYEKVRSLPHFEDGHCPFIEIQQGKEKNYVLQYHRRKSFKPATHVLDRELEEGELEADFVVGATPPEGVEMEVNLVHRAQYVQPLDTVASFDQFSGNPPIFQAVMSQSRKAKFMDTGSSKGGFVLPGHSGKTMLLKPELFVAISLQDLGIKATDLIEAIHFNGSTEVLTGEVPAAAPTVKLRVISDGRKAYVKRID